MPFKAGEEWKGNAKGRPKKFTIHDYITDDDVKSLVKKAKQLAEEGKVDMIKYVLDHALGKAPQSIEVKPDKNFTNYYEELETEELINIIKSRDGGEGTSEEGVSEEKS